MIPVFFINILDHQCEDLGLGYLGNYTDQKIRFAIATVVLALHPSLSTTETNTIFTKYIEGKIEDCYEMMENKLQQENDQELNHRILSELVKLYKDDKIRTFEDFNKFNTLKLIYQKVATG